MARQRKSIKPTAPAPAPALALPPPPTPQEPTPHRRFAWSTHPLMMVVVALAITVASLVPTESDCAPRPTDAALFPAASLVETSPLGDRIYTVEGGDPHYVFGRFKQPVETLRFHTDDAWILRLQSLFRTKYWHYSSVNTPRYFIGAAIVKLGYAVDAFIYVVDKTTPEYEKYEFAGRRPGSLGVTFASSSIDAENCTSFTAVSEERLSFCYDKATSEWRLHANVTVVGAIHGESRRFTSDMRLKRDKALVLVYPVGNDTLRPAYVHKGAGSPVHGFFQLGDQQIQLSASTALGAIDWSRSFPLRCTRWNWASSSFTAKVTTTTVGQPPKVQENAAVGINLSQHVYDIDDESQENAVWINGEVFVLRGVEFSIPTTSLLTDQWQVTSSPTVPADQQSIELQFTPSGGGREDHTKLWVLESDFVQPYGVFDGAITFTSDDGKTTTHIQVHKAFGVVEDHVAVW